MRSLRASPGNSSPGNFDFRSRHLPTRDAHADGTTDSMAASHAGVSLERHAHGVQQEAQDLSELSSSIQEDLQKLQKGMLAKDLHEKLKKLEKLAKRLRQDVEP